MSLDSFYYYGTDDLYLNYLARFVKPGGAIGIAGAGLMQELDSFIPKHLRDWWTNDLWRCLHSAPWWRRHWERTQIMDIEIADTMPEGCQLWLDWHRLCTSPDNEAEIKALEADRGEYLGYVSPRRSPPHHTQYCQTKSCPCQRNTTRSLCCAPSPDAAAKTVAGAAHA